MKTGVFDPWYGLKYLAEQQATAEIEVQQAAAPSQRTPIRASDCGPEADARRKQFMADIKSREANLVALEKQKFAAQATDRERTFVHWLYKLWDEAYWIHTIQQFPNGKPMNQQSQHKLHIWLIFISAINRRMWGDGKKSGDGDYGSVGSNWDSWDNVDGNAGNMGRQG